LELLGIVYKDVVNGVVTSVMPTIDPVMQVNVEEAVVSVLGAADTTSVDVLSLSIQELGSEILKIAENIVVSTEIVDQIVQERVDANEVFTEAQEMGAQTIVTTVDENELAQLAFDTIMASENKRIADLRAILETARRDTEQAVLQVALATQRLLSAKADVLLNPGDVQKAELYAILHVALLDELRSTLFIKAQLEGLFVSLGLEIEVLGSNLVTIQAELVARLDGLVANLYNTLQNIVIEFELNPDRLVSTVAGVVTGIRDTATVVDVVLNIAEDVTLLDILVADIIINDNVREGETEEEMCACHRASIQSALILYSQYPHVKVNCVDSAVGQKRSTPVKRYRALIGETPVEKPAEQPVDPVEKPAEEPVEVQPEEQPAEQPETNAEIESSHSSASSLAFSFVTALGIALCFFFK